jgi:thioredoxin-related protein
MKSKQLYILGGILIFLALLPLMRTRPPVIPWTSNLESAFETATKNNVAVIAYLYTDWCGYCRQMDNTTFKDPALIDQISSEFAWLRLNPEKSPDGQRLQRRFGVSGFPTVLVLDSEGNELTRIQGFVPPARFLASLRFLMEEKTLAFRLNP